MVGTTISHYKVLEKISQVSRLRLVQKKLSITSFIISSILLGG